METAPDTPAGVRAASPRGALPHQPGEALALVCLGWVPWGRSWKRNQSMVYELSQRPLFERTVFVNPRAVWLSDQFRSEEGALAERLRRVRDSLPRRHGKKIRICSQWHIVPFKRAFGGGRRFEDWMFRRMVRQFVGRRPFVLVNNHPNFFSPAMLQELMQRARLSVFDLSDDFVEFFTEEEHRELFRRNIEYCCSHSDLVFTVNEHVAAKYGACNPNTYVIPNSTNFENFHRDRFRKIPWLERIRRPDTPILGCTGIINRIRIDYELLELLVTQRSHWQFVFVGSADPSFLEMVARHPNMYHHGQVPYSELPDWIHGFDAAIIPFRINEHTRGNDLLKFHDYLSMGKSVVTTDTGGARRFEGLLHIASDAKSFLDGIEAALQPVPESLVLQRIDTARRNSWRHRSREIEAIFHQHLDGAHRC